MSEDIGSAWSPIGEYFYNSGHIAGKFRIACYRNVSPDGFFNLDCPGRYMRITNEEALELAHALIKAVNERREQFANREATETRP